MIQTVTKINDFVNGIVWGWPALILLAAVGILMTVLTKFFQVAHIGHWFKKTLGAIFSDKHVTGHTEDKSISQFQSFCTALAGTVGTGNIVGVSGAIIIGGPGAVFWMWIIAFFGMMTKFSEIVLGMFYRRKNSNGEWSGGPMYYLKDGLGAKKGCKALGAVLGVLFAAFTVLASFGIGNMTQINSISGNMESVFHVPTWVTGVVLLIVVGLVVIGGLKRIASVTEKIVPFMVILYIVGAVVILITNFSNLGRAFAAIFKFAFSTEAAVGGTVGTFLKLSIEYGMKRGVFSNEAGLGSSVLVHSNTNASEPVVQAMWGIFEVFADTIIVCTLTALTILSSSLTDLSTGAIAGTWGELTITKANLISTIFTEHFGVAGGAFVAIAVMLFAFSTVLGWSHYGTKTFEYLFGEKAAIVYKVLFVAAIYGGAVMGDNLAWDLADTFNGLMMIPNLIGVLVLSPVVLKLTNNYIARKIKGEKVKPMVSAFEEYNK